MRVEVRVVSGAVGGADGPVRGAKDGTSQMRIRTFAPVCDTLFKCPFRGRGRPRPSLAQRFRQKRENLAAPAVQPITENGCFVLDVYVLIRVPFANVVNVRTYRQSFSPALPPRGAPPHSRSAIGGRDQSETRHRTHCEAYQDSNIFQYTSCYLVKPFNDKSLFEVYQEKS